MKYMKAIIERLAHKKPAKPTMPTIQKSSNSKQQADFPKLIHLAVGQKLNWLGDTSRWLQSNQKTN